MRSLAVKLTLAFLLLGITGAVLVSVILYVRTRSAFNQFILNRDQQTLITNLEQYYQVNGSWDRVANNIQTIAGPVPGHSFQGAPGKSPDPMRITLLNASQTVIYGGAPGQVGQPASSQDLKQAVPLTVKSQTVGWVVFESGPFQVLPNSPEANFLSQVNQATLLSALTAVALAFLLGSLLAFTLTRSLRELTEATVEIAQGKLGRQVRVRSQDELGDLARSFNQMSLDLERATQVRRQMTADIAHDLRSPLSVISGYAEALSDGKLPGTPEVYEILYHETQHLRRLVDDLRTLSLADAGELSLNLQPIDPNLLLERVAARHQVAAQQKGIDLRVEPGQNLPAVNMDMERMVQVMDNLVLNAFRYTPQRGEVVLSTSNAASQRISSGLKSPSTLLQFQVHDTGSGIPEADLPYIFDRFYKGDKARQQSAESGLGLAIAKSIVEAHGGTIAVASKPGQGTTFTITI